MSAILTLTMNPCIDKSSRVDNVVPERKLRCRRPRYEPGGGGINVSRAIGRLGGKSVALYLAGGSTGAAGAGGFVAAPGRSKLEWMSAGV